MVACSGRHAVTVGSARVTVAGAAANIRRHPKRWAASMAWQPPLIILIITNFIVTLLTVIRGCGSSHIVHYTTPGGGVSGGVQVQVAGLWRGRIDVDDLVATDGRATDSLRYPDFICAEYKNTFKTGLAIDSISIDWASHDVVLRWNENFDPTRTTMLRGDICDPQPDCINTDRLSLLRYSFPSADSGAIQPVLTWKSDVYFLYTPSLDKAVHFGYQPRLEFRRLTDCAQDDKNSDVDKCSVLLANLTAPGDGLWMEPGSMLYAVSDPNDPSATPTFFTTVRLALYPDPPRNTTLLEHRFALVAFRASTAGDDTMEARIVHQVSLWSGWYTHGLPDVGGLSHRDGVLCWTAVDRVLCGQWTPGDGLTAPRDVQVVVAPGEAAQTCHTGGAQLYSSVTTGVALVAASGDGDELTLMFGCWSGRVDHGGMGLVSVDRRRATKNITKITDDAGPVLAGMVFVTEDDFCGQTETTTADPNPQPSATSGDTGPTSRAASPMRDTCIWLMGWILVLTVIETTHTPT